VDEQQVLAQLEKVLSIEREVKRAQVTLLVRIKNKLTPEQQAKLVEIRSKAAAK
jgi:Spy/CpxP family protein refolding chaperone